MSSTILVFSGLSATTAGSLLIAGLGPVLTPPPGVFLSEARSVALASLVDEVKGGQAELGFQLSQVETYGAQHEKEVQNALKADEQLDAAFSGIQHWITAAEREGAEGAADLKRLLFPNGSRPVSLPEGRPQLGQYEAWLITATSELALANPAYPLVAAKITAFQGNVAAFKDTLALKDRLDGQLTAARRKRDDAQKAWHALFTELIDAIARLHGTRSAAFRAWMGPVNDWRAAQKALKTRKANEKTPTAAPTETPVDVPAPTPVEPIEGEG